MRILTAAPALLVVLALTACGPTPAPSPTPSDSPEPKPTETVEAPDDVVLDEDVLLHVTATATGPGGELALDLQVHRAESWDVATESAALMTSTCEGGLDASIYEAQLFSFAEVDLAAEGSWTGDNVRVLPNPGGGVTLASTGFLSEDDNGDPATPHCVRARTFASAGEGTLVLGLEGDSDELGAAGNFTRWANTRFGFIAPAGVTISGCAFTVTAAGEELNGGADWWSEVVSESECSTGASAP
jgi:hypothetical protein